jgi:nicotinamidase-related amidase
METVAGKAERPDNALLIIDVQVGLVKLIPAEIRAGVLSRIETLLSRARASGTPVIYIQHDGPRGHPLETHTKGWDIHPSIKPLDSESVVNRIPSSKPPFSRN